MDSPTIDFPEELDAWIAEHPVPPGNTSLEDEWKAKAKATFSRRHTTMLSQVLVTQHDTGAAYAALVILRLIGVDAALIGYGRAAYYELVMPDGSKHILHPNR